MFVYQTRLWLPVRVIRIQCRTVAGGQTDGQNDPLHRLTRDIQIKGDDL